MWPCWIPVFILNILHTTGNAQLLKTAMSRKGIISVDTGLISILSLATKNEWVNGNALTNPKRRALIFHPATQWLIDGHWPSWRFDRSHSRNASLWFYCSFFPPECPQISTGTTLASYTVIQTAMQSTPGPPRKVGIKAPLKPIHSSVCTCAPLVWTMANRYYSRARVAFLINSIEYLVLWRFEGLQNQRRQSPCLQTPGERCTYATQRCHGIYAWNTAGNLPGSYQAHGREEPRFCTSGRERRFLLPPPSAFRQRSNDWHVWCTRVHLCRLWYACRKLLHRWH